MAEKVSLFGLAVALAFPWLMGTALVACLLRQSAHRNAFLITGHGYLAGVFVTTLLIRLIDVAGFPLHFLTLCTVMLCITTVTLLANFMLPPKPRTSLPKQPLAKWERLMIAIFLGLIVLRYTTILQELWLRPLFPWDAWMNWAPKAIVWFHYKDLVPFVSGSDWLNTPPHILHYTAGATRAWEYPDTVPLIQFWTMLGAGISDDTLIYLPWLFVAVALGLATYGHLRESGSKPVVAAIACYALLNLPFLNVYVALSGYADIWVAASFGGGVFALHQWNMNHEWPYALLSMLLAGMCALTKIPGVVLGAILLIVFITTVIRLTRPAYLVIILCVVIFVGYGAMFGIDFSIPQVGEVVISRRQVHIPYIGDYRIAFHPVFGAIIRATFLMINWNLLWYLFLLVGALKLMDRGYLALPSPVLRSIILALCFIYFVYLFSDRYVFALNFTQINRALFYVAPALIFYIFSECPKIISRRSAAFSTNPEPTAQ